MESLIDLLPPIITAGAIALISWFLAHNKDAAQIRVYDAETIGELRDQLAEQQAQIIMLGNQITVMRADYEKEIASLRRLVNRYRAQLREAGIEPVNGENKDG